MSLINMLNWWQWAVLAAVPPAIVLLYFLKLKRLPLEVPSTYLWHKSIEDLRVNSIWQRLRRSLLLFLQLLLVAFLIGAVIRPGWRGRELLDSRLIFLVDNSASMAATDVKPTRLAEAKRRVGELIDQMSSGDVAMIVSFSDSARVEQKFSSNRRELRRRLDGIRQTNRTTSLSEALHLAAGLANPGRSAFDSGVDRAIADSLPATVYIFSDGKFPDVRDFSLGNLKPVFVPIGESESGNVAVTAFSTRRPESKSERLQAFARIENFSGEAQSVEAELYLDDTLLDADKVQIKPAEFGGVVFDFDSPREGVLKLKISSGGDLKLDDQAWAAINPPRQSRVLLVTPGNQALQLALETERATQLAEVTTQPPTFLSTPEYEQQADSGRYDLIIFDQCAPAKMPQSSTLFVGRMPPLKTWNAEKPADVPQIIDVNTSHPLLSLIELGNVQFARGTPLKPPAGATVLVDSDVGALLAIAPREGHEDAVLGAEIVGVNEEGERMANTNWPLRLSFPVFVLNALEYFGGTRDAVSSGSILPGRPVELRGSTAVERLKVRRPSGEEMELSRGKLSTFNFSGTEEVGVYGIYENGRLTQRFAVNLFDPPESAIRPRPENAVRIGYVDVKGERSWQGARREAWKYILLAALAVSVFEWYIYNRRVYI